jgi:protein TonB
MVLRGLGFGLDQEAIRAVQGMPRWQPGYQNGRPVAVVYHLPVQFSLR